MIHWRAGVLALLLFVSCVACATRPTPRESVSRPLPGLAPEVILASFDARWQMAEAVRALAHVSITSAQGRYSTRQTFFWRRPAFLRLDSVSLFGQSTMSLVADPTRASIYYPQQATFFQGPATAATLARFIGLPLDVEDIAPLLMGSLRPSPAHQVATIYVQTDEGMPLLRFLGMDGTLIQDVWVDPSQVLPKRALRYTTPGLPAVDISYSDFRPIREGFPFPFELMIWVPWVETEVHIQFLTVDLNPSLPPSVFQLSPPAGVRVVPLE
jgi:outer membrane lipoprotein-sorting protein